MTSLELLLCAVLVFFSAYMSASEIALFSLSRFQLRSLKENFRSAHRKIKRLLGDPGGLLITILVVNEVLNIALSTLITRAIARHNLTVPERLQYIPPWAYQTLLGTLVTAPVILFLCEITPKVIGARVSQVVAPLTARPLIFIYEVLKPIRMLITAVLKFTSRWLTPSRIHKKQSALPSEDKEAILKESDFLLMLEEGHKEGAIQGSELELIRNVFELDQITVASVATPLSQVLSLPIQTTVRGALITMRSQRYSRIPVIAANRKEVSGILYSKDLLRAKLQPDSSSVNVATLMRKPFFVNPSMTLSALFRKFKQQKIHMAIVKAPNGEVTGVVTMSDILEALFEDLFSEAEALRD
jgi:CBS domain containing-hemolysin-like protein